jgi:hypothetical protein
MIDLDFSDELRTFELKKVILSTIAWENWCLPPLRWRICHFESTVAARIPKDRHGVYTFVIQPGIAGHPRCSFLAYVGKAAGKEGFRARYAKYRAELNSVDSARPLVNRMVKKWHKYLWFCYADVADPDIDNVEDELLKAYLPPINTEFPAKVSAAMRAF